MNDRLKKAKYISSKIKELRSKSGMSQAKLAEYAGITGSAISQIEAGNRIPSLIVSQKIASALKVSTAELTGDKESLPSNSSAETAQAFFRKYQNIENLDEKDKKIILNLIDSLKDKGA